MIAANEMNVKTIVRYDRSKRTWQTVNGKTSSFGPGKHNKRRALRHALRHDWPEMYHAVINFWAIYYREDEDDQLMDRLLKAAMMLAKGLVYRTGRVQSQSEPDTVYNVINGACDCLDWQNGVMRQVGFDDVRWGGSILTNGQAHCKHTLAVELAHRLGLELPDEEIPF